MTNNSILDDLLQIPGARVYNAETGEFLGGSPQGGPREGGFPAGGTQEAGLSHAHISPGEPGDEARFLSWGEGTLIKAKRQGPFALAGGGKRGKCKGFTRASRRRMLYKLGMTKRDVVPLFVTLTYPDEFSTDARMWKRDLDTWFKRLKRKHPEASAIWRMEFKRRKSGKNLGQVAPHFHLLVWGVEYSKLLYFTAVTWYQVVGSGDVAHLQAGSRVERIRSPHGAKGYAAKYAAKLDDDQTAFCDVSGSIGRVWGVFNATFIPWAACEEVFAGDGDIVKLFRLMRRYARLRFRSHTPSITLLVNDPTQWLRAYWGMG